MNEQEYAEQSERVSEYNRLSGEIKRLNLEKSRIDSGILSMDCLYKISIDCCGRYDGFSDNLQKSIIQFYDDEIERLEKLREEI